MHIGRHTTAQSTEIHSFGVHLSTWLTVVNCGKGKGTHVPAQRAGNFFFRGTGLPTAVRKNQPLVPQSNIAGSWTRGGGGVLSFAKFVAKGTHRNAPRVTFTCVEVAWVNILAILMFPSSP